MGLFKEGGRLKRRWKTMESKDRRAVVIWSVEACEVADDIFQDFISSDEEIQK